MSVPITSSLEFRLRQFLPVLTLVLAALMDLAPIPSAAPGTAAPDLLVAAVFFWSLHRPDLVPPVALFCVALGSDLVSGSMIGLTPALMLLLRETVVQKHRLLLATAPLLLWAGFSSYAASLGLIRWLASSAYSAHWQVAEPVVLQLLLTMLAWPVAALLLSRVQTALPGRRHAAGG